MEVHLSYKQVEVGERTSENSEAGAKMVNAMVQKSYDQYSLLLLLVHKKNYTHKHTYIEILLQ